MKVATRDCGDDFVRQVGIGSLRRDEAALGPTQTDIRRGGGVHAPFLRAEERLVVLLADDNRPYAHVAALRQGVQRLDDEGTARWRIPFDEDDLGIESRPLQLSDKEACRALDAQDKVVGVAVVTEVGDESNVWLGVHVELSRMEKSRIQRYTGFDIGS